ncbi:MAG: S41 family peptidase [Lachnospiraceae bacterium]|nr:S41 family peptidase [Lachnospiraceae bacterium]
MKIKRHILGTVIISILVLAMTAGSADTVYAKDNKKSEKKITYKVKELPVVKSEPTDETIKIRYYSICPHVPYVGIKEFYDCIMEDSLDEDDVKTMKVTKEKGSVYTLESAHGKATVDTAKDVMTTDDLAGFTNIMCLIQEGLPDCYCDGIPYVRVKDAKITGKGNVKFDFAKYNMNIFGDGKDVYFPVSTLSDIFTDLAYHYCVCNGETFYFNSIDPSHSENIADLDPDYAIPIVDMLDDDFNRPEDLAEFGFNKLCFSFDYFYGLPGKAVINDELGEMGLEKALEDYGEEGEKVIELLKSRSFPEYYCGLGKLGLFVDDKGHTVVDVVSLGNAMTDELQKAIDKTNEELEKSFRHIQEEVDRIDETWNYYWPRKQLRDDAYKNEKYLKEGDTAVYVLDSFIGFDIEKWNKYYKEGGAKPTVLTMRDDDMLLIEDCLKDAAGDPKIKNFVIDCSNNTGGSLDEVAMLYCLISGKREITFHYENALTGQKIEETYEADLNFDRKFDEDDARDPYDLNIAVLTSSNSFSCGNIFPSVMKDAGYLIMGERSGGGACAVLVPMTGEGMSYRFSAYKGRFINEAGEIIDNGVEVDVNLIPNRSNGEPKYITVKEIPASDGGTVQMRSPDYSDFYKIDRLSEEINKYYKD